MWEFYIELYTKNSYGDLVSGEETSDGIPICSDFNVAKSFRDIGQLNEWVKENTSLHMGEYGIKGIYY